MATSSSTRRMIGGIEETSASFEARSAPRSYPTEADGHVITHRWRIRLLRLGVSRFTDQAEICANLRGAVQRR
jgi:hypothetical protein